MTETWDNDSMIDFLPNILPFKMSKNNRDQKNEIILRLQQKINFWDMVIEVGRLSPITHIASDRVQFFEVFVEFVGMY